MTGKTESEKLQEICNVLRKETIEPAKNEADKIILNAKEHAERIIKEAQQHAAHLLQETKKEIDREKKVLQSALHQAGLQSLEALRQSIEEKLFNSQLHELVQGHTKDPKIIAELISAMVKAVEKEGLRTNISALIPKEVSSDAVNALLAENILKKLKNHSVELGDFKGGAKIRLHDQRMTLDISNTEIEDLLKKYLHSGFRKLAFSEKTL